MFQYSICAFLAPALVSAMAFPWAGPEPTLTMPEQDNWSPVTTPAPKFEMMELFKRAAGDNTCGYISGDPSRSLTCNNANYVCATNTYYGVHGCCDPNGISTCTLATTCIPSSSINALCTGDCATNSYIAKCTNSAAPFCYQWRYVYASTVMTEYGCASSPFTISVLRTSSGGAAQTTSDIGGGLFSSARVSSATTTTPSSTAASSSVTSISGSAASQSSTSTATTTPTPEKKTNIGAIVGGVVGGLVVIGAIAFGAIFLILRNRKNKKNAATTNGANQPMMAQGPGPAPGVAEYKPQQPQNGGFPSPGQQYGAPPAAAAGYFNHDQKPGFNQMGVPGQEMHPYSPPGSPAPQYPGPAIQPQYQMPMGIAEAGGSPVGQPVPQGQQPPQGHVPPPQQQPPHQNIYEAP